MILMLHIGILQQASFIIYITLYHEQNLVFLGNIPNTELDQNEIHCYIVGGYCKRKLGFVYDIM